MMHPSSQVRSLLLLVLSGSGSVPRGSSSAPSSRFRASALVIGDSQSTIPLLPCSLDSFILRGGGRVSALLFYFPGAFSLVFVVFWVFQGLCCHTVLSCFLDAEWSGPSRFAGSFHSYRPAANAPWPGSEAPRFILFHHLSFHYLR